MKKAGLTLDAQIDAVARHLAAQHQALRENLTRTQAHARDFICTHPLQIAGLAVALVWLSSRLRRS